MIEDSEHQQSQASHKQKQESKSPANIDREKTSSDGIPAQTDLLQVPLKTYQNSGQILSHIFDLLENQPSITRKPSLKSVDDTGSIPSTFKCKCKKTKCLKMYCECFAAGKLCDGCACTDCNNLLEFEDARASAIDDALCRDPDLFKLPSQRQKKQGCICKKTSCLKKYCECYSSGLPCGPQCKCINCNNV